MCLQSSRNSFRRLGRIRDNARLFHLIGNVIRLPFASSIVSLFYRLTSSRNSFRRSSTSSILEPNSSVRHASQLLYEQSRAAFLIGRSVHQARLSVSFETVVPSFPHHFPCSLLCEHREKVQQGCRLLFVWWSRHHHCWRLSRCFQRGRIGRIERTRVSVECEIPVVKVFPRTATDRQVRTVLAFRLSFSLGAVSTPTVPLFSRLLRVPTLLRSSQCSTTD